MEQIYSEGIESGEMQKAKETTIALAENDCHYSFKFGYADFTFVTEFPNLEWILYRRRFGKYSHTADEQFGTIK